MKRFDNSKRQKRRPGRPRRKGRPNVGVSRSATKRRFNAKKYRPGVYEQFLGLPSALKNTIIAILILMIGVIIILGMFGSAGRLGELLEEYLTLGFGVGRWLLPVILVTLSYYLMRTKKYQVGGLIYLGAVFFILSFNGLIHLILYNNDLVGAAKDGSGGGLSGLILGWPLFKFLGFWASIAIATAIFLASLFLFFRISFEKIGDFISGVKNLLSRLFVRSRLKKEINFSEEDQQKELPDFESREFDVDMEFEESNVSESSVSLAYKNKTEKSNKKDVADKLDLAIKKKSKKIDLPLSLLNGQAGKPTAGDIKSGQIIIQKTFKNFGIEVEMGEVNVGPTVTQYTIKPAEGIKLSRLVGLSDNLALALAAHPIRIEAPIPNMSLVGVEVPNRKKAIVPLREVLDYPEFHQRKSSLMLAMGKDVKGQPHLIDLGEMPHMLICGATNSGKSVCVNTIILSLLFQNSPDSLRFIMVDPKRVELPIYNDIPHLLTPVITDVKKTINALKWSIAEMERRFDALSAVHKRDIKSFNESSSEEERMPYIVIIIDELADLMVAAGPEIEHCIIRLAQMSRAIGIHLVVATQRPSVDVLTGLIKANIPARVAFSVASLIDSRTILDTSGAEKLLGRGDMLYLTAEISKPKRLQGAFATDEERKRVTDYLKKEWAEPNYNDEVIERSSSDNLIDLGLSEEGGDPLLTEAKEVIIQAGKASASLLQRRLRIGYARAARILDLLEGQGFIGPADGAKPREILRRNNNLTSSEVVEKDNNDYDYEGEEEDKKESLEDALIEEEEAD